MAKRAIYTKEEIKEKVEKPSPIKEKEKKEKKEIKMEFECPFAPGGEGSVSFVHIYEGKEYTYNLKLNNKRYVLPKDLKENDIKRYRKALLDNKFMDVTVIDAGFVSFDKEKKEYVYTLVHPEHTQRNRINANIALVLQDNNGRPVIYDKGPDKGKQMVKQVTIVEGIVKTDDVLVYEALLKAGFYSGGKKEK